MKEIILDGEIKLIGCGGVSKVYECKINAISVTKLVVFKEGCNVKTNYANFKLIKSINLRTLLFVEKGYV